MMSRSIHKAVDHEYLPAPQHHNDSNSGVTTLLKWFSRHDWQAFSFQRAVWQAYLNGQSGLIYAATGTGKTLAAWGGILAEWINENNGDLSATKTPLLRALWITPMRALAADTRDALILPIQELNLPWTVGSRTGDTSSGERAKQAKRLPSALVTTPESLSLMLTRSTAKEELSHLHAIVVDEWHELMGTKRGVQTELCLARLKRWNPGLRIWGLSATLGNLDEAMESLLSHRNGVRIAGEEPKSIVIDTLLPASIEHFPWAGHLGIIQLEAVAKRIEQASSTLLFTNTRSQVEQWYQGLLDIRPDWAGEIALHHGSLSRDVREWVETALKEGRLHCVICTSSLDLGVDFSPVEQVLQVGSPKGVARLLQRAGRSGHTPGGVSRVTCVPSHAFEIIEAAAVRHAAMANEIETRRQLDKPLDLLVQHLVTIALGGGFYADELFTEITSAHAYRYLTKAEWEWALDFVTHGGNALAAYAEYQRVIVENGFYRVENATIAKRHRMAIGTITADAAMEVRFRRGARLGYVEESFISHLHSGETFLFAGRKLTLLRVDGMTAYVKPATGKQATVPRWMGGKMSLSSQLAKAVQDRLQAANNNDFSDPEMRFVVPLLDLQHNRSKVPMRNELLIELLQNRDGWHCFVFPFQGRHVHTAMAALAAYRMSKRTPSTFSLAVNDYGFALLSPTFFDIKTALADGLFSTDNLMSELLASLNAAELSRRHFREIARVAGLVFQGYPGSGKSARQLQASSGLLFDVFQRWDADNPLLMQATREVLERELEYSRLEAAMRIISLQNIVITEPKKITPFAFPLLVERFREGLSSEKLADRVERLQMQLQK